MSTADKLKNILAKQKEVLSSLETEIIDIEESNLVIENESLKRELQELYDLCSNDISQLFNCIYYSENKNSM